MNDLKILTAQPQPVTVDGETYMVHPLDVNDWGALQAWLDRQRIDPFDAVKAAIAKGGFSMAVQQYMIDKALEKAMKPGCKIGSVEADELLTSMEGYAQVFYLAVRKGRPDFTEADAMDVAAKLAAVDMTKVGHVTTMNMMVSDPKDEPLNVKPPLKKSGSAASRRRPRKPTGTGG
jgi:hypothetical protein